MSSTFYLYLGDECHILEEILSNSQMKIREEYKSLFDFSLDLIWVHDLKGNFLDANDIALKTLGYTREEISNLSFKDLMDKDQAQIAFNIIYQAVDNEKQTKFTELKLKTKEGNSVYLKSSGIPLKENGEVYAVLCIAKDITEHKKVEQILKDSKEKYRSLIEGLTHVGIGIVIISNDYKILFQNQFLIEKYGDLTGKICYEKYMDLKKPCDFCPTVKAIINNSVESEEITTPDEKTYELISSPFPNPDGTIDKVAEVILDITERKKSEQKLKESEEKHRLISENANDLITILNQKFEHEYINEETYLKILGYSNDDMLGKTRLDLIHPDDLKQSMKALRNGFKYGEGIAELRLKHKDGHYIWIETKGKTFIDSNGETKALTISRDISERKNVEKKIVNLAKFPSENPNPVLRVSREDVLYINKAGQNLFKIIEGSEIPKKLKDDVGKAFRSNTTGELEVEINNRVFSLIITPVKEANYANVYGRDISECKKAEQKLKESEEKYRSILENIEEGYFELDLKGNYTFVNEYHSNFYGVPKDEIIGKNYMEFVDKKYKKILFEIFNKVYRREVPSARFEIEAIRYDGEKRIYEGTCNIKLDSNGKKIGFYSLTRDITERKEAEKLIIEELNKLTELDRMRREFISRASHELKTPLTSIYSTTQLLLELYKDQLGENALELVEMIEKGGYRLKGLVEKLLDFSRIESGRFQLNKKMENATEIIRDCISNMAYLANKRNIILNVDLPETFNIELDKVRFEEVVINLLSNAIKNTPPIGDIQISLSKQNGFMVLSVKDSGVGLTRSERGKIFKKFGKIERYGKGLDIIPEGVGLRLFISKEIVENHGGKIFVESKGRNKGANFIVKLPFK